MYNQYLPTELKDEIYLLKEGDDSDKVWDEEALKLWEREENDGREWEGGRDTVISLEDKDDTAS